MVAKAIKVEDLDAYDGDASRYGSLHQLSAAMFGIVAFALLFLLS